MTLKVRISDMMDYINDDSVKIQEKEIASANRIKEATMKRIEKESPVANFKIRKISRVGMLVAVLALSMMFTGGVFAHLKWNGFANTSEMSKSEKEALLKNDVAFVGEIIDPEGNVHYLDANGKEVMVLSKEEAAKYEKEKMEKMEQEVQESTELVDVHTLPLVPSGITEVKVDKNGQFDDFALGVGHMIVLLPEDTKDYSLKKGNSVTISLNADEECILQCGLIKDGKVIEETHEKKQNHKYSFEITEDGKYNFYIMYYSAGKNIFTECMLDIK